MLSRSLLTVAMAALPAAVVPAWSADLQLEVAETGLVRGVTLDGRAVAGEIGLRVAKPQWQGMHATLGDAKAVSRQAGADGGQVVKGVMPAAGEPLFDYTWSLTRPATGVRLDYEIVPRQDVEAAAVIAQVLLKIEGLAGQEWVLAADDELRRGRFPAELPDPYTFVSESGFDWLAWRAGGETSLALVPDWGTVARVTLQDDRQFKMDTYEVQIYSPAAGKLAAGQPIRIGFEWRAMTAAEVTAPRPGGDERATTARRTLTGTGPAAIRGLQPKADTVPAFGLFEVGVDLTAEYSNPFDPADVALDGHIVGPDGREEVVPGFYWWGYERARRGRNERLAADGTSGWSVRYCPRRPGAYRYWVTLSDGGAPVRSEERRFTATASEHPGFVRVSKTSKLYFETDNGQPYFAIGENICWPGPGGTYEYDNYWQRLGENGANYARIWVGPFDCFTLERTARDGQDPAGLGRIDLAAAWRLDYVLDLAARHGLRVMFCIDSFNSLRSKPDYPMWDTCPYNAAVGGPCATPGAFFTDPAARELFRHRLRYIAARWGAQPAVLSWEFWNEVDIIDTYTSRDSVAWHQEMARWLRGLDPSAHLITTSWAGMNGDAAVNRLPEMDYVQSHQYGARDEAAVMGRVCLEAVARFDKPHYFGEFGTGTRAEGTREDEAGIHLHNGLWCGLMSNAAGTCMLWWWDNYVEPRNLYHHFRPLAEFVKGVPLNTTDFRPVKVTEIAHAGPPPPARLETLDLSPEHASWTAAPFNQPNTFVCQPDGRVDNRANLSKVLHGTRNHPTLHNPATFEVDYPRAGEFVVRVSGVSAHGGANLAILVDDQPVLKKDFPDPEQKGGTLTTYNGDYRAAVPAGRHRVQVVNDGPDWVYVDYRLPDYRRRTDTGLVVYGLGNGSTTPGQVAAILWLKNERYTWYQDSQGVALGAVPPSRVTLGGIPDGAYQLEWWDTTTGKPGPRQSLTAAGGQLAVTAPEVTRDLAAKLYRATP